MLNKEFGGEVERNERREDGQFAIDLDTSSQLFQGLSKEEEVLLTHGDSVTRVADGFVATAYSGKAIQGEWGCLTTVFSCMQFIPTLIFPGSALFCYFSYREPFVEVIWCSVSPGS